MLLTSLPSYAETGWYAIWTPESKSCEPASLVFDLPTGSFSTELLKEKHPYLEITGPEKQRIKSLSKYVKILGVERQDGSGFGVLFESINECVHFAKEFT